MFDLRLILAGLCAAAPLPAMARPAVMLDSAIFIEHSGAAHGTPSRMIEPAQNFTRGERVVTLVSWTVAAGRGGFTVVNALPPTLAWQKSADGTEEVSVDGGRNWGRLEDLRVGTRRATPEDVTHVRWHISPQQALVGAGRIAYAGFVR
ncbi:MAG: hypothetical protein KGK11_08070 [Sphingomonadales bacterium]|nr:hypothetical protein [Sphingomonadales bacterium]